MLDLTAVILTYNEELHIRRCLENIRQLTDRILVIDCFSTDRTVEIAKESGAKVVQHEWPGNQAEQFNWALDNIRIDSEWILRLDADEYLTDELIAELNNLIPSIPKEINALVFPLGRAFMGRILLHGIVNGICMIRMFRKGKARYEHRLMDEHLQVLSGKTYRCKAKFIDDNRMSLAHFIKKHNDYSMREALVLLNHEYGLFNTAIDNGSYADEVRVKREEKDRYAKMPLFLRAFAYFIYRYIFKLGFLDGKEGFLWDFLQGWWYRTLVDAKVFEIKKACGDDVGKMREYIKDNYKINLNILTPVNKSGKKRVIYNTRIGRAVAA